MKSLLLSLLAFVSISAFSQSNLVIRFEHNVGAESLELNEQYTHPGLGYNFSITRLQYYISEIEITHDGGQKTMIEDTWLLVDASQDTDFELGSHSINSVEGISYWIGVDKDHNHLDPTQYESGHPLAPQNPAMHWGWAAGYRFTCLEGKTGLGLVLTYQIHALGDANYFNVNFETGAYNEDGKLVIPVLADYMGLYDGIDVSSGLIEHSETAEAADLLENFSTEVFSPVYFTDIPNNIFEGSFAIGPNCATDGYSRALLTLPTDNAYNISLFDITGKLIMSEDIRGGNHAIELAPGKAGVYFVRFSQNGSVVTTEKLVVTR